MSDAAVVESPRKSKGQANGKRIGAKANLVHALLSQGFSHRSVSETVGVSRPVVQALARQEIANPEHAERIKKGLRNRFALVANESLNQLSDEKLAAASAKELIYIAAKATEMAGLAPPSVTENYSRSLSEFFVSTPQQVVDVPKSPSSQVVTTEKDSSSNT